MKSDNEMDGAKRRGGADEPEEPGLPTWTEGIVPPKGSGIDDWKEVIPELRGYSHEDDDDLAAEEDYEIVGGEGFPPHEHRFTGDRCEVCGGVRRYPKAA